jgi:hypothetical protein
MLPGLQNQDSSSMGWSGDKGIEIDTLRHMEVFTNFYKDAKYKHEKKKKKKLLIHGGRGKRNYL